MRFMEKPNLNSCDKKAKRMYFFRFAFFMKLLCLLKIPRWFSTKLEKVVIIARIVVIIMKYVVIMARNVVIIVKNVVILLLTVVIIMKNVVIQARIVVIPA